MHVFIMWLSPLHICIDLLISETAHLFVCYVQTAQEIMVGSEPDGDEEKGNKNRRRSKKQ